MKNPTERFSDRVHNYTRYRPSYPNELVDTLIETCSLNTKSLIADVGSGTGILTQQLLDRDLRVTAVEPNLNMRQSAEATLSGYEQFTSIDGQAEKTGLADSSVNLITAAQAFHWFNNDKTKNEFRRVLKSGGWLAIIWNQRKTEQPLQKEYDKALRKFAHEYESVNQMNITKGAICDFFERENVKMFTFKNSQLFDKRGFLGRLKSSSYCPSEDSVDYFHLKTAIDDIYDRFQKDGKVSFEYHTRLYLSQF